MLKFFISILLLFSLTTFAEQIKLTESNSVSFQSVVYSSSVSKAISDLAKLESNEEPVIYLVLDTPGGSVFAGLDLINYLKAYKKPVKTITLFAASMGFQIAEGNPGDRLITPTGILMSHPMSGGLYGEFGSGMSVDNQHEFLKQVIDTMDKDVVARTQGKQTLESYKKSYDNELWSTGSFAVDSGYADQVIEVSCESSLVLSENYSSEREFLGVGPAGIFVIDSKMARSKCPLSTAILKYQVAITEVISGNSYIIYNSGYDIEATKSNKYTRELPQSIKENAENTMTYKQFKYYLTRDLQSFKKKNERPL